MTHLIGLRLVIAGFTLAGVAVSNLAGQALQQPVDTEDDATTLAIGSFDLGSAPSAALAAASIVVQPGQTTLPLESQGGMLLVVQAGEIEVTTDRAAADAVADTAPDGASPPLAAATNGQSRNTPGSAARLQEGTPNLRYVLTEGAGIALEPSTRFRISGVDEAEVLLVTLVPT